MAKKPTSPWAQTAAALAVFVLLAAVVSGLGHRWGWWHFRTGFQILRYSVYAAIVLVPIAIIALVRTRPGTGRRGLTASLIALLIPFVLIGNSLKLRQKARSVPPIHDITTDTNNPPPFVKIAPLRADASNPVEYAGEETAAQQKAAYPDIQPLRVDLPPAAAFERALSTAENMGWTIVDADETEGRIEATAQTFWYGFTDDVVIRVKPNDSGSVIDVRSKSRVGRSDVGANADRIRAYRQKLNEDRSSRTSTVE